MPGEEKVKEEGPHTFPEKYLKKLNSLEAGFTDAVDGLDTEEIKKRILTAENNLYDIEREKERNLDILAAKEALKEMTAPFAEVKALETAKIKYCIFTLENRGVR